MINRKILKLSKKLKSFEFRIAAVIITAVLVVMTIGFTAYSSLTKIVKGVSQTTHQDGKLLLLKDVLSEITEAESNVKSFTITNDIKYLKTFNKIIQSTENKIKKLNQLSMKDSSKAMVDSLDILVQKKYMILNEFIALRDTGRVDEVLSNISDKISPGNNQLATTKTAEKKDLISRIFNRIHKKPKNQNGVYSFKELQLEIDRLRYLEEENTESTGKAQLRLTEQDKIIMDKIRDIFKHLETKEHDKLAKQSAEAEVIAAETNNNIALFTLALTAMLCALGYFILRNIKQSREYRLQLERAKTETEQLSEAKELFLANISHEIRTPLHAITGFSEQLMETSLKPDQRGHVEIIKKSGDHLMKLVNNVLDLTKIHAGKLVLISEPIELEDLISDAVNLVRPMANEKMVALNLNFDQNLPAYVYGDPVKFKQILLNILSNAVKFTPAGQVDLYAKALSISEDNLKLEVRISDTGIGISHEQIETIFDEFVQANNKDSIKQGGTGLGLTISKKLCEFLGGTLKLKSKKDKGTTVWIELPFKIEHHMKSKSKIEIAPSDINLSGKKILIADDEVYNLKLLGILLAKWNVEFKSATTGVEVLREMKDSHFDALLIDLSMPEMDGFETARQIRANTGSEQSKIPIVALTASAEPEIIGRCKNAGIEYVITKPYKEDELLVMLGSILFTNDENGKKNGSPKYVLNQKTNGKSMPYDLAGLKLMAPDDNAFIKEMLETFVSSTRDNLNALMDALGKKEILKIHEIVHKMTPPCRHLAMREVLAYLNMIEKISNQNEYSEELVLTVGTLDGILRPLLPRILKEIKSL